MLVDQVQAKHFPGGFVKIHTNVMIGRENFANSSFSNYLSDLLQFTSLLLNSPSKSYNGL